MKLFSLEFRDYLSCTPHSASTSYFSVPIMQGDALLSSGNMATWQHGNMLTVCSSPLGVHVHSDGAGARRRAAGRGARAAGAHGAAPAGAAGARRGAHARARRRAPGPQARGQSLALSSYLDLVRSDPH